MSRFLDEMAVFAAVARDGSFTAAGQSLGITKQSVSERVARLEERLGVQLLIRSTRALRLTEVGMRYCEACAAIVAQADQADREARQSQEQAVGTVRVTALVGLSAPLVMPAVRDLQRTHPGVRLELLFDEKLVDLVRDGVDLAVRAGSTQSTPSFIARPLFECANVLVASPALLAEYGRPAAPRGLQAMPCIARRRGESWAVDGQAVAIDGRILINTYEAGRDAALAGLGVARIPTPIVLDDLRAGRLEPLLGPTGRVVFTALWPARRLPTRVRVFLDLLLRHARELAVATDAVVASAARRGDDGATATRPARSRTRRRAR